MAVNLYEQHRPREATVTVSQGDTAQNQDYSGDFVCDGTADDVELQAALDYSTAFYGSGEVLVFPGNYYLAAKVEVPSYTIFRALSSPRYALNSTTYLRLDDGVDDDVIGNKADAIKIEIHNFDVWGNRAQQANGHGINIDALGSIIAGNYVNDIKQNAINCDAQSAIIQYNHFQNIDGNGIDVGAADSHFLFNSGSATGNGIYVNSGHQEIIGNLIWLCGAMGIWIDTSGDYCTLIDNRCNDNTTIGINVSGQWSIIANNRTLDNGSYGIQIGIFDSVCADNFVYNNDEAGISLTTNAHRCTVVGNVIKESGEYGILVAAIEYTTITGNTVMNNGQDGAFSGIYLYDGAYNVISSNIVSDDQGEPTQQHGILLRAVASITENIIINNVIRGNQSFGINVGAGALRNTVKNNILTGNGVRAIQDQGTETILDNKSFPFIQGTTFISADGSAKGWEINAEADMAVALGQLPLEIQQVLRIKIWAVALGAPAGAGGQMHLDILFNAGGSLEAYNLAANSWTLANFDGEEADYVNTNVVHWVVEDGDVGSKIRILQGGDSIALKVNGGTALAPDGATNATFRAIEVEYV